MALEIDLEGYEDVELNDDALQHAINQAEEAVRAGWDEQSQLIDAIKAYVFVTQRLGVSTLPVTVKQAKQMHFDAEAFLIKHNRMP